MLIQTNKEIKRIRMKPEDVWNPFFLIYSLNLIILIVWTVLHPQTWKRFPVDDNDGLNLSEPDTYGSCDGDHDQVYFSILLLVNIFVLFTALVQSYECRKITTEYYENIWIAVTLVCVLQIWIVALPVLSLFYDEPRAEFLARTGVMIATSASPLVFIFVPKIKFMMDEEAQRKAANKEDPSEYREDETSTVQESIADNSKLGNSLTNLDAYVANPKLLMNAGGSSSEERSRDNMRRMQHRISNSVAIPVDEDFGGEKVPAVHKLRGKVEKAQDENLRLLAQLESWQAKMNRGTTTGHVSFDDSFMGSDDESEEEDDEDLFT